MPFLYSHVNFKDTASNTYSCFIYINSESKVTALIYFSGEAQLAEVELMSVERGLSAALPGELSDVSADSLIRFDELNPFTYTDRSILVKNKT